MGLTEDKAAIKLQINNDVAVKVQKRSIKKVAIVAILNSIVDLIVAANSRFRSIFLVAANDDTRFQVTTNDGDGALEIKDDEGSDLIRIISNTADDDLIEPVTSLVVKARGLASFDFTLNGESQQALQNVDLVNTVEAGDVVAFTVPNGFQAAVYTGYGNDRSLDSILEGGNNSLVLGVEEDTIIEVEPDTVQLTMFNDTAVTVDYYIKNGVFEPGVNKIELEAGSEYFSDNIVTNMLVQGPRPAELSVEIKTFNYAGVLQSTQLIVTGETWSWAAANNKLSLYAEIRFTTI